MAAARQSYEEKDVSAALRTTYPERLYQASKQMTNVQIAEASEEEDIFE